MPRGRDPCHPLGVDVVRSVFQLFQLVILADVILSWLMPPSRPPRSWLVAITDPLYAPFRALIPPGKFGGLDLSPMLLLLTLRLVQETFFRL